MTPTSRYFFASAHWAIIAFGFVPSAWADIAICKAGDEVMPNGKCGTACPAGQTRQQKPDGSFQCVATPAAGQKLPRPSERLR